MSTTRIDRGVFDKFAKKTAWATGQPLTFGLALTIIATWGLTGPLFHYSDTWQLVINTGTTIVTFLMVFLIQNTQNRDSQAVQLKLDELIRATEGAHVALVDLEELTDVELAIIKTQFLRLAAAGRERLRVGDVDTGSPQLELEQFGKKP